MLATSVRTALVALLLVGLLSLIVPTTTAKHTESAIYTQSEEEPSSSSASYSFFRSTSVNNGARGATGTSESHVLHIRKRLNCENCCKGIGSCANNQGKIGNGSCNAMGACANNENEIGDNACSGSIGACANNQGVIGNGSCGGDGDVSSDGFDQLAVVFGTLIWGELRIEQQELKGIEATSCDGDRFERCNI